MMYVMRVKPWKSSNWQAPAPEHRLTTAQLMDRKVAENYNGDEESGNKQAEDPGHMHAENVEENPAGAGPSAA